MSTVSPFIKMALQILDENPDTWGNVLNVSALELLEDAICGTATADVTSASVALNQDQFIDNDPHYRMMIINITGSPGVARDVTCPAISKVYLVVNSTSGGQTITFRTTSGTGFIVPAGDAVWCYCDGTNIVTTTAFSAASATTATTAGDATNLGGFPAADYARLAQQQTFTAGQAVARTLLIQSGGVVTPTINTSNSFYAVWDGNYQLAAPTGSPANGQTFTLVIQQGSSTQGTISFPANTYIWENEQEPTLSTGANDVDYFGFEYCTNIIGTGGKWIGGVIKNIGPIVP